jgi:TRAP-type uncharacterized transport system substrate-binding protein
MSESMQMFTAPAGGDQAQLVRRWLTLLAALALIGFATWQYMTRPTVLKVAVGPAGSERYKLLQRVSTDFKDGRKGIKLKLVEVKDSAEAARLLETDEVQLAVIRSDEAKVVDARSIAVVDKRAVVLAARGTAKPPAADKEEDAPAVPDVLQAPRLAGKRIAIAADMLGPNRELIARLLAHTGVTGGATTLTELPAERIAAALAAGEADVAALVVDPAAATTRKLIAGIAAAFGGEIVIGPPPAPEGLAAVHRDMAVVNLAPGVFGGAEPQPAQKLTTVAVTDELVADSDMSDQTASAVSRALLDLRGRMLSLSPGWEIETPPTDALRRFMPHSGVVEKPSTFLETYSDQLWLGLFALGIVGSSLAGLASWLGLKGQPRPDPIAGHVSSLIESLEKARSPDEIDALRQRLRELAASGLQRAIRSDDASAQSHPGEWYDLLDQLACRRREEISDGGRGQTPRI